MVPDGPGRWFPSQSGFTDASMSLGLARLFCGSGLEKGGQGLPGAVKPRSFALNIFLLKLMKGRMGVPRT